MASAAEIQVSPEAIASAKTEIEGACTDWAKKMTLIKDAVTNNTKGRLEGEFITAYVTLSQECADRISANANNLLNGFTDILNQTGVGMVKSDQDIAASAKGSIVVESNAGNARVTL